MQTAKPEQAGFSTTRLNRISQMLQGYVDRAELAGMSATVARCGQTAYHETFGWSDVEAQGPLPFDAIFRIASMTKPVTSVAAMMLYEEGHFHLNTPLARFVPAFKEAKVFVKQTDAGPELTSLQQEITLRHLFTHTSGLSYGFNDDDPVDKLYREQNQKMQADGISLSAKTLVEGLAQLPLAFQPGTRWRYSFSIDVIGYLVELISGLSLAEYMRQRIFEPLGMCDTGFYVPQDKLGRVARVYGHPNRSEKLLSMDVPAQTGLPTFQSGGGGLYSTLHDYARFCQMLVNGGELEGVRLLSPKTVALYSMNHTPAAALPYGFVDNDLYHAGYGYSLGTRVLMDVSRTGIAGSEGEFGWDGAFSTYFWIDPREQLYGLMMLQHFPNAFYPVAQQFKQLTYQALV